MRRHVIELLDGAARDEPERAFLRGARAMTFGELAAASHAIAAWLGAHGLAPGDRMLITASNHADAIAAALGAARCGVTFAFVHDATRPAALREIVAQVEPSCVVLDAGTAELRTAVQGVPLLVSGDCAVEGGTAISSFGGAEVESVRSDPLCLVYTSGSTGAPRGVMVGHDNVTFTTAAIQQRLCYRREDTVALFLPLSFDYGLYQLFLALGTGASLYVGTLDHVPLRLVDALAREDVTILPGVPLLFSTLVRMLARTPRPLPRLRAVTNTGERLPAATLEQLRALLPAVDVFLMYGLTECKRVSILLPEELAARPGSVGRPLDGTSVEVIDPDGLPVPDGTAGELVVRGPHVTMGYWRAPEETALRFGPRTLFTGDTCRRDRDGFLYFEGRGDLQAKRNGFRFSLLEIESAALAVPGVAEAATVPGSDDGELHLFVATADATVTSDAVLRLLRGRLEPYKIPDRIHVVASLPTTPHGKVDRRSLGGVVGSAT